MDSLFVGFERQALIVVSQDAVLSGLAILGKRVIKKVES
jgi:hypothetical protein